MQYDFVIDKKINIIFEKFEGTFTVSDLKKTFDQFTKHPDYQKDQNILSDFRQAELLLSSDEMYDYVNSVSDEDQVNKLAIVVSRDLEFGTVRMFETLSETTSMWKELKIFRHMQDAKQWLGLEKYENQEVAWLTS